MTFDEMVRHMEYDDLPTEDMRLVADAIGVEATVRLMEGLGGLNITVPKMWKLKLVDKYIAENSHVPVKKLARETGFTPQFIYQRIRELRRERWAQINGGE